MKSRLIAFACLAALLVLAGYWWFSGPDGPGGVNKGIQALREAAPGLEFDAELGADLSLKGVELVQGEEGRPLWRLKARSAKYEGNRSVVRVEDVNITYYSSNSDQLVVTSPLGEIRQELGDARLWPEVTARFGENFLTARQLDYDGQAGVMVLTGDVMLDGPQMSCNATRMSFYLANSTIVADNGVTAVVTTAMGAMGASGDAGNATSKEDGEKE
jgi:hypothetical protein